MLLEKSQGIHFMSQGFEIESVDAKKSSFMRAKAKRSGIHCLVLHIGDIKDLRVKRTKKHQLTVPVSAIGDLYQPRFWAGLQSVFMRVRVCHLWNKTKD